MSATLPFKPRAGVIEGRRGGRTAHRGERGEPRHTIAGAGWSPVGEIAGDGEETPETESSGRWGKE